jgi:hypothetical protein
VRQIHFVAVDAIMRHEKPASEALFEVPRILLTAVWVVSM